MFNKFHKITVKVDPFTYLAISNIARIRGNITVEDVAADILTNRTDVYNIAESIYKSWVKNEEDHCTNDDE